MNGPERPRNGLADVPDPARRAIEELRRLQPPPDLLTAVVHEAGSTLQRRRPWRRGIPFGLAGAGVAAAAVLLVALVLLPGLPAPEAGGSSPSPSTLPLGGTVQLRVPVPDGASPGSADERVVWVGHAASGRVLRVDARTGETTGEIQVSDSTGEPYDLLPVTDGASLWVGGFADRSLVRIDVASTRVISRWPIDAVPYRVLPAGSVIWVTDFDGGRVLRIDATDGTVVGTVDIGRPTGIAVLGASVWVVDYVGNLYEVDPVTETVLERFDVGARASDLLAIDGDLLIWGLGGRDLERFDTSTRAVTARLQGVTGAAMLDGTPWAAVAGGSLARLDAERLVPVATVPLGEVTTDQLVAGGGHLWVRTGDGARAAIVSVRPSP